MEISGKKLFRVLVVGGAALGLDQGCTDEPDAPLASDAGHDVPRSAGSDSAAEAAFEVASDPAGAESEGAPCFCGIDPMCCVKHDGGMSAVRAGFHCCWGTSC